MIKNILELRGPLISITTNPNADTQSLSKFILYSIDFDNLKPLYKILELFLEPTTFLQASSYSTINRALPYYAKLITKLKEITRDNSYSEPLREATKRALSKLETYYITASEERSYYMPIILDPRLKMEALKRLNYTNTAILRITDIFKEEITM